MRTPIRVLGALSLLGSVAVGLCCPSVATAQCISTYELFVGAVPRNIDFAFRNPATGLIMAIEPQYAALPLGGAVAGRTWSWDGASWRRVSEEGPVGVSPAMVTWDSSRSRAITVSRSGQTWEWDGGVWSQVGVCPATRLIGAAITYDAGRAVTILVTGGGVAGGPAAETWEWNGSSWTQRAVTGPSNRHDAALVYDPARNVTVLFGGQVDPTGPGLPTWLQDLWEFNGATWTQRTTGPGPGPTSHACVTYHAPLGGMVIYGGRALSLTSQMWVWNGAAWSSIAAIQPSQQIVSSLISDPSAGRLTLFGRIMPSNNNEYGKYGWQVFSRLDGQAWIPRMKSNDYYPVSGDRAVMAYDTDRGVTVMFGGIMPTGDYLYETTTWEFNGQAWTRRDIPGPPGRTFAAMAYDPVRRRMVLTGGTTSNNNAVAETWEYDGSSWTQVSTSAAAGRRSHTTAFDRVRSKMVVQGGHISGGTQRFDTQEWDASAWTEAAAAAPTNRVQMAYDRNGQYMLGVVDANPSPLTLRLTPSGWTQILPSAPYSLHMEWYDAMDRIVGYSSATRGTYKWTGAAWEQIPVTFSPPSRGDFFSTAYDSRRDRLQIWGGWTTGSNNELWELVRPTADMGRAGGLAGPDGQLDNNDFIAFIDLFFNGCGL